MVGDGGDRRPSAERDRTHRATAAVHGREWPGTAGDVFIQSYFETRRALIFSSNTSYFSAPLMESRIWTLSPPEIRRPSRYIGVLPMPRVWATLMSSRIPGACFPLERHFWK